MSKKKCIIFVRVSTDKQSWEEQRNELVQLAKDEGYTENRMYIPDTKVESGIKLDLTERTQIRDIKTQLETGEYDCVFVWEVSRIGRRKDVIFDFERFLVDRQIQLVIATPNKMKLLKPDGEIDEGTELTFTLFAQLSTAEMRQKKARFHRGRKERSQKGYFVGGKLPYAYGVDKETKKIIINEDEAKVVRLIFELYENGKTAEGQPISQFKMAEEVERRTGVKIKSPLVHHILKNRLYTGERSTEEVVKQTRDGKEVEYTKFARAFPPIISIEQFERCRQIACANNTSIDKSRRIYFGKRLIVCPECGGYWTSTGSRAAYHCYNKYLPERTIQYGYKVEERAKRHCTYGTQIPINVVDSILWSITRYCVWCQRKRNDQATIQASVSYYEHEIQGCKEKLASIQSRKDKVEKQWERSIEMYYNGDISTAKHEEHRADRVNQLNTIENDKTACEEKIARYQKFINDLKNNRAGIDFSNVDRELWKVFYNNPFYERLLLYTVGAPGVITDQNGTILRGERNELNPDRKNLLEDWDYWDEMDKVYQELDSLDEVEQSRLVHDHIEKVYVLKHTIEFDFKYRGTKVTQAKLILVYTEMDRINSANKSIEVPFSYPRVFVHLPFDGKGGHTVLYSLNRFDEVNNPVEDISDYLKLPIDVGYYNPEMIDGELVMGRIYGPVVDTILYDVTSLIGRDRLSFMELQYDYRNRFEDPRRIERKAERERQKEERKRLQDEKKKAKTPAKRDDHTKKTS